MKMVTSLFLLAGVVTLGTPVYGQSTNTTSNIVVGGCAGIQDEAQRRRCFQEEEEREKSRECRTLKSKLSDLQGKAKSACKAAGKSDADECVEKAEKCAEVNSSEGDFTSSLLSGAGSLFGVNTSNFSMSSGEYKGCLNRKDWKDETRDLKKDLEKSEDNVSKIKEKITDAQKKAADEVQKIQEEITNLYTDARKEDKQAKEDERKKGEESTQTAQGMAKQLETLRSEVLRQQGVLATMIGERTRTLTRLTDALLKQDCIDRVDAVMEKERKINTGNSNNLILRNRARAAKSVRDKKACYNEALAARDANREKMNKEVEALESDIGSKTEDIRRIQAFLSQKNANDAQAKAEATQSQSQAQLERQQKLATLNQKQTTANAEATQRTTQLNEDLTRASNKMSKYSNELANLGTAPAGDKSPSEAVAAAEEASELEKRIGRDCGGTNSGPNPVDPKAQK